MRLLSIVIFSLPLFGTLPVFAADPVLRQDFAKSADTQGWRAFGEGAAVEVKDAALELRYTAGPAMKLALLPLRTLDLSEMKSLRFEVRTDSPFAVGVLLAEKKPDGGNYTAIIWSNGGAWQPVHLTLADFAPTEGKNDPVDKDHRLDTDQLENLGILDFSQIFGAMAKGNSPVYAEPHDGPHVISFRNFEVLRDAPAAEPADAVDTYGHPQSAWFTFGGASLEVKDSTLTVRFRQRPEKGIAFSRVLPLRDYSGATHLSLDVQSDQALQLVVSLKERNVNGVEGARHNTDIFIPASDKPDHRDIALSAFETDGGGGRLDLKSIQSITFLDVSGETAMTTLKLRNIRLTKQ